MDNILSRIVKHDNDYSKLEDKYFLSGYGDLVDNPYESYRKPYNGVPVSISVIIPAYNSKKSILACLRAIESNSYAQKYPEKVQVIVVDDGSDDGIYDFLKSKSFSSSVQIIKQRNTCRAGALNTALSFATNDYIVTCDADMVLHGRCLEEFAKRYQILGDTAIFVGFRENTTKTDFIELENEMPKFWKDNRFCFDFSLIQPKNMFAETNKFKLFDHGKNIYINSKNGINRDIWTLQRMAYGCLFVAPRSFFIKIGGYNEQFKGWGYEDTYIGAMAIADGKFIIPVPAACGFHIEHPINLIAQKSIKNKELLADILLQEFGIQSDFIAKAPKRVLNHQILLKRDKKYISVKKNPRTNEVYKYFLGKYKDIKSQKYIAESLFLSGKYDSCKKHKSSLYACLALIMDAQYEKATNLYKTSNYAQKRYLNKIGAGKLLETAELWRGQGSFLFAFLDFSLYALQNGFTQQLVKEISSCAKKVRNGKTF